jgi:RNA polymerase sigma factor (sigma-70 family)
LTEGGFASFYRERFRWTAVLLIAVGASRADAEDATQEAMVKAWEKWDSIKNPRPWVCKVAYRAYLRRACQRDGKAEPLDESSGDRATESDLAIFADEQQRVLRLLRALPPGQRAVAACFYDGLTCEEIAQVVDKPPATVRSQLRHARKALKEMIDTGE